MRLHGASDAVYHNWFSPFLWSQIEDCTKHPEVGWSMSSWNLVKVMKKKDPVVFKKLACSTVESWIDWTGAKPRWSDATLAWVEKGNHPGHGHGGCKGVLVSNIRHKHHT
jgi:hypothetical protein